MVCLLVSGLLRPFRVLFGEWHGVYLVKLHELYLYG